MDSGLRNFTERTADGGPVLFSSGDDVELLMHVERAVSIVLGDCPAEHPGTLYITSRRVIWLCDSDKSQGYAVDFLSISLHAVSRDPLAYPLPCIYAQIDTGDSEADEEELEDSKSEFETGPFELSKINEIRLIPSDPNQLDSLFEVFCECAELNPETAESEVENSWIFSADQMEAEGLLDEDDPRWNAFEIDTDSIGHGYGHHDLAQSVLKLEIDDKRFEDAQEMEQDVINYRQSETSALK